MYSSALLYTSRVLQGSSVLVLLFWLVYKAAFYRSKKKKICTSTRHPPPSLSNIARGLIYLVITILDISWLCEFSESVNA